jgi:hypothetical protein
MLAFTVTVSEADYYSSNAKLHFKGWAPAQVLLAFVSSTVVFASAALIAMIITGHEAEVSHLQILQIGAGFAAFMLAIRFAICWLQLPGTSNKLYAQTGTFVMPTHYQLTPERFRSSYEEGTTDHPWTRFCDYIDAGDVLLLRRTPGFAYFIPMHQLSAQQREDLLSLLTQVGVARG